MSDGEYTRLDDYQGWQVRMRLSSGTFEARRPVPDGTARSRVRSGRYAGGTYYETVTNRSLAGLKKALDKTGTDQAPIAAFEAPSLSSYGYNLRKLDRVTVLRSERVGRDDRLVVQEGGYARRLDRVSDCFRVWDDALVARIDAVTERIRALLEERARLVDAAAVVTPELLRERARDAAAVAAEGPEHA